MHSVHTKKTHVVHRAPRSPHSAAVLKVSHRSLAHAQQAQAIKHKPRRIKPQFLRPNQRHHIRVIANHISTPIRSDLDGTALPSPKSHIPLAVFQAELWKVVSHSTHPHPTTDLQKSPIIHAFLAVVSALSTIIPSLSQAPADPQVIQEPHHDIQHITNPRALKMNQLLTQFQQKWDILANLARSRQIPIAAPHAVTIASTDTTQSPTTRLLSTLLNNHTETQQIHPNNNENNSTDTFSRKLQAKYYNSIVPHQHSTQTLPQRLVQAAIRSATISSQKIIQSILNYSLLSRITAHNTKLYTPALSILYLNNQYQQNLAEQHTSHPLQDTINNHIVYKPAQKHHEQLMDEIFLSDDDSNDKRSMVINSLMALKELLSSQSVPPSSQLRLDQAQNQIHILMQHLYRHHAIHDQPTSLGDLTLSVAEPDIAAKGLRQFQRNVDEFDYISKLKAFRRKVKKTLIKDLSDNINTLASQTAQKKHQIRVTVRSLGVRYTPQRTFSSYIRPVIHKSCKTQKQQHQPLTSRRVRQTFSTLSRRYKNHYQDPLLIPPRRNITTELPLMNPVSPTLDESKMSTLFTASHSEDYAQPIQQHLQTVFSSYYIPTASPHNQNSRHISSQPRFAAKQPSFPSIASFFTRKNLKSLSKKNKVPSTSQRRSIYNHPRTERLQQSHFSRNIEQNGPFRLSANDVMRSVTKFSYIHTDFNKKLKITNVRPVLFPFMAFQGELILTHKPTNTVKKVDYNDVENNIDVSSFCTLINQANGGDTVVREDNIYFNTSKQQNITNPNITLGQDFKHSHTDFNARKTELYVAQPNTVNTLRMRAQQVFSGSEFAPFLTESLKTHVQLAQIFDPEFLQLPQADLYEKHFYDYDSQFKHPQSKTDDHEDQLEDPVNYARGLRATISPLTQTYEQQCQLERAYKSYASNIAATPSKQRGQLMETDESVKSELSCFVSTMSNIIMLELNLIDRGIGVKVEKTNRKDSAQSGAFLSFNDQKHMLADSSPQARKTIEQATSLLQTGGMIYPKANASSAKNKSLQQEYEQTQAEKQHNKDQHSLRLKVKKNIQEQIMSQLKENPAKFRQRRSITIDIPNTDYSVTFDNVISRKFMNSGYISEYDYMGEKWRVMTSAVTGVSCGIKHRHFLSGLLDFCKQSVSLGSGLAMLSRALLKRIVLPPIYVAGALFMLVMYNLRDVLAGHYTRIKAQHTFKRTLEREFKYDHEIYAMNAGDETPNKLGVEEILNTWLFEPEPSFYAQQSLQSQMYWLGINSGDRSIRSETERFAREYDRHRIAVQQREFARKEREEREAYAQKKHADQTAAQMDAYFKAAYDHFNKAAGVAASTAKKQKKEAAEKRMAEQMRDEDERKKQRAHEKLGEEPIPTDPYVLLMGYSYFGLSSNKPKAKPSFAQVERLSLHDLKQAYRKQLLVYHPDMCRDDSAWSRDYAENRTKQILAAFSSVNNDKKRSAFNRNNYQ